MKSINRGIVQGSGLGPTLYSIMESDLTSLSKLNMLFKYADDTNLLVPENSDVPLESEFEHIRQWTVANKMMLNLDKTKEIVFHKPNPRNFLAPSAIIGIEQVSEVKLLGVYFTSTLNFEAHVKFILGQCSQRVYLLKLLRDQGLPLDKKNLISQAVIVSRFICALPAGGGFATSDLIERINAFFAKIKKIWPE